MYKKYIKTLSVLLLLGATVQAKGIGKYRNGWQSIRQSGLASSMLGARRLFAGTTLSSGCKNAATGNFVRQCCTTAGLQAIKNWKTKGIGLGSGLAALNYNLLNNQTVQAQEQKDATSTVQAQEQKGATSQERTFPEYTGYCPTVLIDKLKKSKHIKIPDDIGIHETDFEKKLAQVLAIFNTCHGIRCKGPYHSKCKDLTKKFADCINNGALGKKYELCRGQADNGFRNFVYWLVEKEDAFWPKMLGNKSGPTQDAIEKDIKQVHILAKEMLADYILFYHIFYKSITFDDALLLARNHPNLSPKWTINTGHLARILEDSHGNVWHPFSPIKKDWHQRVLWAKIQYRHLPKGSREAVDEYIVERMVRKKIKRYFDEPNNSPW